MNLAYSTHILFKEVGHQKMFGCKNQLPFLTWQGYSFENICIKHYEAIKQPWEYQEFMLKYRLFCSNEMRKMLVFKWICY